MTPFMIKRRLFAFSIITAFIVLFSAAPIFATWNKIFLFPANAKGHSAFFFNEFVGLIGSTGYGGIHKTTDGGKTWKQAQIPPNYHGPITQIFMVDSLHGWATVEEPVVPFHNSYVPCLFKTIDGGLNWTLTGPGGYFSCVYQTPNSLIVTTRASPGSSLISIDNGATFQQGSLKGLIDGVDFVDNLNGVATGYVDSMWQRTLDGGRTWMYINPPQANESWGIYGVKGTPIYYTAPEIENHQVNGGTTSIYRSANYGATWSVVNTNRLGFYTTGHIAGVNETLYIQEENDATVNKNIQGIYRSTDKGQTWQSVGGPSNQNDTRFAVIGCDGGVIYAFDIDGNVWKTRDGGDGQIQEPPVTPQIYGNPIVFSGPICSTSFASLQLQNLYCVDDTIISAQLVDTTSALITSGALKVSVKPSFPLLLLPNTQDSISFIWKPFKLFHSDTTAAFQIKVKYFSKILGQTFDTIVTVSVHAVGESPLAEIAPTTLNFNNIAYCIPHDTTFVIKNNGCDTLYILNANGSAPQHFVVLDSNGKPLQLPLGIPPSDSDKIIIRLNLDSAGSYSSNLLLKLRHQGIGKDTSIAIAGIITTKGAYAIPDTINFGLVSTCVVVDTLIPIKNNTCIPLIITGASLQNKKVFTLVGAPPYTSPILPDSTGFIHVQFSPNAQTVNRDILTISFTILGESQTKNITLNGSGYFTPAMLVASPPTDTFFNLHLTRCDKDTVFHLFFSNPGCDSITITSAQLTGAVTPNISLTLRSILPLVINNGKNIGFSITVAPKDIGTFNGTLDVKYIIAKDNTIHDTLLSYFLTVGYGTRILTVNHDTIDLGTMKMCDSRDSAIQIKNLGCDSLDILNITIQGQGNFTEIIPSGLSPLSQSKSGRISFHFDPTQAGAITGTITINSASDTLPIRIVTIIAQIIPTDTVTFTMLPTHDIFHAGDTLTVRLIPQSAALGNLLQSVAFNLNYNSDLLTLISVRTLLSNTAYILGVSSGPAKHTSVRIFLNGMSTINFAALQPVLEFKFYASLTDSIFTSFDLTDIVLNGGSNNFSKCELGIVSASLSYQLAFRCGDSTLVRFMQLGNNLKLFGESIYPNPVSAQNNYQAIIPFKTNSGGSFDMNVFDQLGRMVISKELVAESAGTYHFNIDGRSLFAGCYIYMLQEISSSSRVRGSFIITK